MKACHLACLHFYCVFVLSEIAGPFVDLADPGVSETGALPGSCLEGIFSCGFVSEFLLSLGLFLSLLTAEFLFCLLLVAGSLRFVECPIAVSVAGTGFAVAGIEFSYSSI